MSKLTPIQTIKKMCLKEMKKHSQLNISEKLVNDDHMAAWHRGQTLAYKSVFDTIVQSFDEEENGDV